MPTTIPSHGEVRTPAAALAAIKRHLAECRVLATAADDLAVAQCRQGGALDEFRNEVESLYAAIQDQAEPALACAVAAEREMANAGEVSPHEANAAERRAYLARVI